MEKKAKRTVDKKIFCYTIKAKKSLEEIFGEVYKTIDKRYDNLEQRGLIYTNSKDGYKYFLDVKDKSIYDKKNENGKLSIFKCILYKLREDEFPYLFDLATGKKSEIIATPTDTLMEQTHFIMIPEINIIISEYNYIGGNLSGNLLFIIKKILGEKYIEGFNVSHILNAKTSTRIRNLKEIRKFQFKAGHQGMRTIAKYCNIGGLDAIEDTFANTSDLEFEITIKGKGRGKSSHNIIINGIDKFKSLCEKINDSKDKEKLDISKAKILDASFNSSLPIDLFEEYLVTTLKAVKLSDKSKYIDSEDMFYQLIDLYNNDKFELSGYKEIII